MIRSMTAFANCESEIGLLTLNCEIRSVNHRYCDIYLKLPERIRFFETEIRSAIVKKIKRGKVECAISYKKRDKGGESFTIDMETVTNLLKACNDIALLMQSPQGFSALDVLTFPGVQLVQEVDRELLQQGLRKLIDDTLRKMLEVREREGQQLGILLEERCKQMQVLTIAAKTRLPEVLTHLRRKLLDRINELNAEPDFDRLEQEMIILIQKLDVDEELDRLETHINEVLRVLRQGEPIGRRLDFLMQEMNREANTLGSKSSDKEMTRISIELKVLIEQMREQIQNIE